MGIHNRDYIRDSAAPYRSGGGEQSGWKWIIGITVGVFLFTMAALRGLQTQVFFLREGQGWSFLPYLGALVVLAAFIGWVALRMRKAFATVNPDRPSGNDPVGDSL